MKDKREMQERHAYLQEKKGKVRAVSSIRTQIILLLVAAIALTVGFFLWALIPATQKSISVMTRNYMYDVAVSYGEVLDVASSEEEDALSTDNLRKLVGGISVNNMNSSYIYVVDVNGTMLYHPTEGKIGQSVENEVVSNLVADLQNGKVAEPDVVSYEFNGVIKYAAYYIGANENYILA